MTRDIARIGEMRRKLRGARRAPGRRVRPNRFSVVVVVFVAALVAACTGSIPGDGESSAAPPSSSDGDARTAEPDGDSSASDGDTIADAATPRATRGATLPYDEYEAEEAITTGTVIGPSRTFGELATEASGRRAVRLDAAGQSVTWKTKRTANSIVVRFSIPDAPAGGGIDATLGLYVDGAFRADLQLTSRYAWIYGGESGSSSNDPKTGGAHHFYDEARALIGDVPAGASIELRRRASDAAPWYVIDLVDLELVAPPLEKPSGALSIADFGATPDDGTDDGPAIAKCIAAARASHAEVFIPKGVFHSTSAAIDVASVTIRGAGMWHSTVRGFYARFRCTGDDCRYADFSVVGETVARDDASPESAFLGGAGSGSRLDRIWVEHEKTGYWVGPGKTDGLVISGCRFRDLFADGVNLCNGASHSIVEQSHARNTGDDAFASWSPASEGGVNTGNVFRFDSVQLPWRANCFAIYGGEGNAIEDSTCADVVEYPGVLLAQQFGAHPFAGSTSVARVTLTRAGGTMYGREHGALKLQAFDASMGGFSITDVDIVDATHSGLHFQGPHAISGVTLSRVHVASAGTFGFLIEGDASGDASASDVIVEGAKSGGLRSDAGPSFAIVRGSGNAGW